MAEGEECTFCKIIQGEEKSWKIYEDEKCMGVLDAFPLTEGHALVMTKKHIENVFKLDEDLFLHLFKVGRKLVGGMKEGLDADFVNIVTAPSMISHAAIHVIPRYDYDLMGTLPDMDNKRKLADKEMKLIQKKITEALK